MVTFMSAFLFPLVCWTGGRWGSSELTADCLLDVVEDEVHEGVVALERALDCVAFDLVSKWAWTMAVDGIPPGFAHAWPSTRTFSSAGELDVDVLVHVLCQVENVFLLGPLALVASCASASTTGSCPPSPTAEAAAAAAASTSVRGSV